MDHRNRWFNPFKMVIVHSFFYVYQKVTKMACWSACTLGAWHIAPTCGHKRGEGHWIQRRGGLREENMTETMVFAMKKCNYVCFRSVFSLPFMHLWDWRTFGLGCFDFIAPKLSVESRQTKTQTRGWMYMTKKMGVSEVMGVPPVLIVLIHWWMDFPFINHPFVDGFSHL